jgi:hypothetical protein
MDLEVSMRRDRYTVAFDEEALKTMAVVASSTNYQDIPDFIRAAVTVMVDLLDASGRKLKIVMRDDATGREWEYSPHEPGRATPVPRPGEKPPADNVFRPTFGRQPENQLTLGAKACESDSGNVADLTTIETTSRTRDRKRGRR